jgi:hypothetical protein
MSQHDDFLEGFGDALRVVGITDSDEIEAHYGAWLESTGMNDVERIDLEGGGYETGLEAGTEYRKQL